MREPQRGSTNALHGADAYILVQILKKWFALHMPLQEMPRRVIVIALVTAFVAGCSAHKDEDVTKSPKYNFGSFAGTTWKTKVSVALADIERYTGEHQINLMSPRRFDPTVTNYAPVSGAKILTVLPAGTVIRIERFVMDGGWAQTMK
jgi:hypothetical protein